MKPQKESIPIAKKPMLIQQQPYIPLPSKPPTQHYNHINLYPNSNSAQQLCPNQVNIARNNNNNNLQASYSLYPTTAQNTKRNMGTGLSFLTKDGWSEGSNIG